DVGCEGELDLDVAALRGDDPYQGVWATPCGAAGLLGLGPKDGRAAGRHQENDGGGGDAVASEETHRFLERGQDQVIGSWLAPILWMAGKESSPRFSYVKMTSMEAQTRPPKTGRWSEPALRVLTERYLSRREGKVIETPEEMCWRVARAIADAEGRFGRSPAAAQEIAAAFYDMMIEGQFLPNSPTLMNAGKDNQLQYSACYVLPVGDSMEEIFDSVKAAAIIHKSGGGTGFAFSRLRPKDDLVASTGGRASGPVSFLRVFNSAPEARQERGTRRG